MKQKHKLTAIRRELREIQKRLDSVEEEIQRLRILITPIHASTAKWMNVLPPIMMRIPRGH